MTTREKIILEAEDRASREFDNATGGFERMDKTMRRAAVAGGIAIAGAALVRVGAHITSMAVDAKEAESAFETSFGKALPQASAFVEEFAIKAGFATHELQQMLAVTGSVVQGIGATEAESAALAESMARLAGDVASFSNAQGGAEAVMMALQSAINGEREALKTYGLALSEAEVQERALQETQKTRAADLTRLEKAQATVTLAYEKAGKAAGDLDRTEDSAANTLRRLQARVREAGTELGGTLLTALDGVLPKLEEAIPLIADAAGGIAQLAASALTAASGGVPAFIGVLDGLAIAANSVVHVGAGLGAILGEIWTLGKFDSSGNEALAKASAHANDLRVISRELRGDMAAGGDAATVYANGLAALAASTGISADGLARFQQVTGATAEEQRAALTALQDLGRQENWRPENMTAVAVALASVNEQLGGAPTDSWMHGLNAITQEAPETAAALDEIPSEAEAAAKAITDMAEKATEAAAAFRDDLAAEANDFITGFEKLPDKVDTTMSQFEANMTARIETQAGFWEGLTTLAAAGLGHLAEEIRAEGPTAAGLLEDMVGDMERAAELDDMIRRGGEQMGDVTDAYATALEDHGDSVLTPLGEFGTSMIEAIAEGIEAGDLYGPLLRKVRTAVNAVVGGGGVAPARPTGPNQPRQYDTGTWAVPGTGPIGAIVHGGETIFGPPGTSGRTSMVRDLATELSRVLGGGGDGPGRTSVHIGQILVTVPPGTTVSEAITEGAAQGAIEAIMN